MTYNCISFLMYTSWSQYFIMTKHFWVQTYTHTHTHTHTHLHKSPYFWCVHQRNSRTTCVSQVRTRYWYRLSRGCAFSFRWRDCSHHFGLRHCHLQRKKCFFGGQVVAACERGSGLLRLTYNSYKDGWWIVDGRDWVTISWHKSKCGGDHLTRMGT